MYICCGEVSWGANEQGAGPYKGLPPHDIMLSEVSEEEEMLRDVIDERLQALDAIDCLLQDWQSRARREGPESLHRLEYALATLPILKQYFQSYLEGEESGESGEEEEDGTETSTALRLRIVERRLRSMEFCEGCPQADRREFIQEVDRVFADLKPSMDRYEQDRVLMTADERVPALRACYEEISKELRAIYITIRRRVVLDLVDMWDDVPEHIGKQDADHEDDDLYDPRHACCEWLLETAIFTGYSGPSASSSIQTAQGTSRLAQPRPSKSSAGLGTSAQRPCRKIGHEAKHVGPLSWVLFTLCS